MSALTQKERDGLDDVFLSINSGNDKYKYTRELLTLVISKKGDFSMTKLFKQAKYGVKQSSFSHFLAFITKKKKNLSK